MHFRVFFVVIIGGLLSCHTQHDKGYRDQTQPDIMDSGYTHKKRSLPSTAFWPKEFLVDGFDFPVGKPDGKGYYNAQPFGVNFHLGDDWNGLGGGNTDFGDSIFAIASGCVRLSADVGGGWGKVLTMLHCMPDSQFYLSLYGHCDQLLVAQGDWVEKGEVIGTIGNAGGQYYAHLHLEIRTDTSLSIGPGYAKHTEGYVNPTTFIKKNRHL